jgi:hypothetical protein
MRIVSVDNDIMIRKEEMHLTRRGTTMNVKDGKKEACLKK